MKSMKHLEISGIARYHNIETGFWGITDEKGNQWRPVNMPDQLKVNGSRVRCVVREVEDEVSVLMWGTPVEVISFHTTVNKD